MSANEPKRRVLPNPFLYAFLIAIVASLLYWQGGAMWRQLRSVIKGKTSFAYTGPDTLIWKQPILPAQFAQGSCGACHKEELPQTPRLNHGRELLVRFNCIGCHQLQDIERPAMLGPDLTNVGTKVRREWIYKWLKEPRTITDADGNVTVNGVATDPRMPKFQLSELELRALSAYLSVQRAKQIRPYKLSRAVAARVAKGGDPSEQGQTRYNQMFCVTCHAISVERGGETKLIGGDIGPELTKVGNKVNAEWLVAWLRDPQSYLQHTKMPQFQWSDDDLYEASQYLLNKLKDPDLFKDVPQLGTPTDQEIQLGRRLFVEKGCAECHFIQGVSPQEDFGPDLSALGIAAGPYLVEVSAARKLAVPLHFVRDRSQRLQINESIVPRAMIDYIETKITGPVTVTPEARMPQFHFSQSDLDDITTALLSMSGPPVSMKMRDALVVPRRRSEFYPDGPAAQLYEKYKCLTCHMFKGNGGTLAPDLSFEGSRSRKDWLVQFLRNPETLRPTLTVRMPRFNMPEQDAEALATYLSASLQKPGLDPTTIDEREFTQEHAERGKILYEQKYQCQSCHTIGSTGGYVGPSLSNAGGWLTAPWIEAWLRNPQQLVPGTIEPRHTFSDEEIRDLTSFLLTLRQAPEANQVAAGSAGGR